MELSCEGIKSDVAQRYEVLMDIASFGVILVDLAGEILEVNRMALKILGSPSIEATKSINMLSYKPLEDVGVSQLIRDAISNNASFTRIFHYKTKWNKDTILKCKACPVIDSCNAICFIVFTIEDVSEIEGLKDKYYRASRTLASVVDAIKTYYIWAKDTEGRYHVVSKSFAELFHKQPMDIVGLTDYQLFSGDMADAYTDDDNEVLSTCGVTEIHEIVDTPLMGSRQWRTTKSSICDDNGKPMMVVGIAEDVTAEFNRRLSAQKAIVELEKFIQRNS